MISMLIKCDSEIQRALGWAHANITKGLRGGPVLFMLGREERTAQQNSKGWPMWRDIAKQVEWHGQYLNDYEWKMMLTAIIKGQKTVPGIEGGYVILAYPSSHLSKDEFSQLIELTYAFGAEKGVEWSEKALEAYEKYKEVESL